MRTTVGRLFNVLVLLTMALGLVAAPTMSVSADPEAPEIQSAGMRILPGNARAGAHYVFWYQVTKSVPIDSTVYVKFPPEQADPAGDTEEGPPAMDDNDDSLVPDFTYDTGNPLLAQMWLSWGPDLSDVVLNATSIDPADWVKANIPSPVYSNLPTKALGWQSKNWLERGEVRLAIGQEIPEGYFVRIDFWGPSTINPGEMDAGIVNPNEDGTYPWCVATDEESDWECMDYDIAPPFAVRLYRKYQIPTYSCGYERLVYISGFTKIQPALDAADAVWMNDGEFTDEEMWNLFEDCPTLDELIDANGDAYTDAGQEQFLDAIVEGVAVGAIIVVDADSDGDGFADVYTETLLMDTPGVILGSMPSDTVDRAIIEAGYHILPKSNYDGMVVDYGVVLALDAGVAIEAGGITFGASDIQLMVGDPTENADVNGVVHLNGFIVQNAGVDSQDDTVFPDVDADNDLWENIESQGISVYPDGEKCVGTDVFANTLVEWTVLSEGVNFEILDSTTLLFTTTIGSQPYDLDIANFQNGYKLVNLTTGWNGHIANAGAGTLNLEAGMPLSRTIEILPERFRTGDAVAIFEPSAYYVCNEARVDIRGNDIVDTSTYDGWGTDAVPGVQIDGYGDGIHVFSASVWVDGNNIYSNDGNGFWGDELMCAGGVIVCDGIGRSDKLLELSDNTIEANGLTTLADWTGQDAWDDVCFVPEPGDTPAAYDDAGIKIVNTEHHDAGSGALPDNLYIHDNTLLDNNATGLWLDKRASECGVRVVRNNIEGNTVFGVASWARDYDLEKEAQGSWIADLGAFTETTSIATGEADVIFKYNNVTGNGLWGVKNFALDYEDWIDLHATGQGGPMFNAKENFWNPQVFVPGDPGGWEDTPPGGPSAGPQACAHDLDQRSDAKGLGDAVDKGTFYNPWLAAEFDTIYYAGTYQGLRAYGSDTLMLQPGWNTLAAPLPLDNGYDTVEEIETLGTFFLDGDGDYLVEQAWQYNHDGNSWDDLMPPSSPGFVAARGYFIKIDPMRAPDGTRFPVIYFKDGIETVAYDMTDPGWYLVGAPFGIDDEDNSTEKDDQGRFAVADPDLWFGDDEGDSWMYLEDAFASIDPDTAAGGAALVASPGVPGQLDGGWAFPWNTATDVEDKRVFAGQSYWVFMKEPGILAGFESAPLYFAPSWR